MVACSMGEVTVLTGVTGLRVDGVNCGLGALSFECSMEAILKFLVRALRPNVSVTVTMARSYQSEIGYGGRCTGGRDFRERSNAKALPRKTAAKISESDLQLLPALLPLGD